MRASERDSAGADEVLQRLVDMLQPGRIMRIIDEPVDKAAEVFAWPTESAASRNFAQVLASFLQHIYRHAFPDGEQLSPWRAHDEVIALLQADAQDPMAGGYIGAALDTRDAEAPPWYELGARITGAIKTRLRRQYVQWVLAMEIDPRDWSMQCALTEIVIERMQQYLPPEIAAGPPERWASQLSGLLGMYLGLQDEGGVRLI